MKKFLTYCLLFVFLLLVLSIPLEYLIRQIPNPYSYKYEWMQKNAKDVEILVFGSSHAMYGIRPQYLEGKAFNLAFESQTLAYDYFLLNYFSDKYSNLKTIVLPISYFTLFFRFEDLDSWWKCRYHHIYMDCQYHPYSLKYKLELAHFPSAFQKLKTFLKKKFTNQNLNLIDEYGWGNTYSFSKRDTINITNTKKVLQTINWQTTEDWSHIDEIISSLEDIISFCRTRNIRLCLITTPTWHTYYDNLEPKQLFKMSQLIDSISKKNNLPYLNYMKDSRFTFDDFYDNSHLNDIGATKFSKILDKDIKSLK